MSFDVTIIGGGPAGMFAAITAAQRWKSVLLLERNDRLGKKLLITGKGRCNVTNDCDSAEILQNIPRNGRFLYSAMTEFPPKRIMEFLENAGCDLKTERGNRVFPVSDKSQSVLEALQKAGRTDLIGYGKHCLIRPPAGWKPPEEEKKEEKGRAGHRDERRRDERKPREEGGGRADRRGQSARGKKGNSGSKPPMSAKKKAEFAKKRAAKK